MDRNELENLYIVECWSQRKIAKHFGCSQTSVRYYINKYNLRIKDRKLSSTISASSIRGDRGIDRNCTCCKLFKKVDEFYLNEKGKGGSWCKNCVNNSVLDRQRTNKKLAIDYKGGSCISCGFNKYDGALEFHHLDPNQKDFEINRFSRKFNDQVKLELDKCVLLCANCHRMAHAKIISV